MHLVFGEKRKWEKTGKKKGEETKRQNRRSDDNQKTEVPKTPEKGKSGNDFATPVWHLFLF